MRQRSIACRGSRREAMHSMGATNYTRQMAANALLKLVHRLAGGEGEFEDTAIGRMPEEYLILAGADWRAHRDERIT